MENSKLEETHIIAPLNTNVVLDYKVQIIIAVSCNLQLELHKKVNFL